jgi:hypothetical protein
VTGTWPFPGETPLQIARQVARAYRERLHLNNRELCEQTDQLMIGFGQPWVVPGIAHYDDDQAITGDLAAQLVSRTESVIKKWACTPHPERPGEMLLPRHGWSGKRRTYLVSAVKRAAELADAVSVDTRRAA